VADTEAEPATTTSVVATEGVMAVTVAVGTAVVEPLGETPEDTEAAVAAMTGTGTEGVTTDTEEDMESMRRKQCRISSRETARIVFSSPGSLLLSRNATLSCTSELPAPFLSAKEWKDVSFL